MTRVLLNPSGVPVCEISSPADLDAMIIGADRIGAHHRAHLWRQQKAKRVVVMDVQRTTSARDFKRFAAPSRAYPTLVVVGADDGLHDGPEAWPIAPRLIRWSSVVILHGAAAAVSDYELAVVAAERHGRTLLVECESAALPAWKMLADAAPNVEFVWLFLPRDQAHPLQSPSTSAH
jgi:hypothetical protein